MALFEGELGEVCQGVLLEAPAFFLLHGSDDDVFRHGASYLTLADLLQPFRVCTLHFDEANGDCRTLTELAQDYARRVLADLDEHGGDVEGGGLRRRVALVGYGLDAVVAHRTALALRDVSVEVALILLDSEVTWPPEPSVERLGGYPWLGGQVEAALLACRAFGLSELARREVVSLQMFPNNLMIPQELEEFLMRIYWELASVSGMPQSYFERYIQDSSYVLERMQSLAGAFGAPDRVFEGPALLLLARASLAEFGATARTCAERFCGGEGLEVVKVPGTHYNMCQRDKVGVPIALPQAISEFLLRRGFFGPEAMQVILAAAPLPDRQSGLPPKRLACAAYMEFVD